jgi:hypothetical protein
MTLPSNTFQSSAMARNQQDDLCIEGKRTPLQMISQGVCLPGIPRHPTFAAQRQWLLERMALAFRVFARKGYTDGMAGHISVRDPENLHTFWTVSLSTWRENLSRVEMLKQMTESASKTLRPPESQ